MALNNPAGLSSASSPVTPAVYTWASKPSAATYPNAEIHISDVNCGQSGTGGGARFVSNGVRWKPLNGRVKVEAVDSANVGAAVATEQVLTTTPVPLPAALVGDYDRLVIALGFSKSGTSETCTIRLRYGTTGTTADTLLLTITTLAGANQSFGTDLVFKRLSATSLQKQGNADPAASYLGAGTSAYSAAVTVSNMDSSAMRMTITAQMSVGAEIPTLQDYSMFLESTDNT